MVWSVRHLIYCKYSSLVLSLSLIHSTQKWSLRAQCILKGLTTIKWYGVTSCVCEQKQPGQLAALKISCILKAHIVSCKIPNEYFIFSSSENYEVLIFLLSFPNILKYHMHIHKSMSCGIAVLHIQMKTSQVWVCSPFFSYYGVGKKWVEVSPLLLLLLFSRSLSPSLLASILLLLFYKFEYIIWCVGCTCLTWEFPATVIIAVIPILIIKSCEKNGFVQNQIRRRTTEKQWRHTKYARPRPWSTMKVCCTTSAYALQVYIT